jgi:hypothetical protein
MADALQDEVERNYAAFVKELPTLLAMHGGKAALMRDGAIVAFFDTVRDADVAGQMLYADGRYSVQEVTDVAADLGFFSHAVPYRLT